MNTPITIIFKDIDSKSYDNVFTDISVGINETASSVYGQGTVNEVIDNDPDNQVTVSVKLFILIKGKWTDYGFEHEADFCSVTSFLIQNFEMAVSAFNQIYIGSNGIHNCPYKKNEVYHLRKLVAKDLIPPKYLMFLQRGHYKINIWVYKTLSKDDVAKFRLMFAAD